MLAELISLLVHLIVDRYDRPFDLVVALGCLVVLIVLIAVGVVIWAL